MRFTVNWTCKSYMTFEKQATCKTRDPI